MKDLKFNINKTDLLLHSAFWLAWIVVFTLIQSIGGAPSVYLTWLMYYIITLPVFVIHTYLIAYWLLPVTFFKGKYPLAGLGLFILLVIFSAIELVVSNELVFKNFSKEMMFAPGYLNPVNIIVSGIGNHYIILVFLAIKAGLSWYNSKTETAGLLQTKTETELEIYRYQLQPKLILTLMEELEIVEAKSPEKMAEMIIKISGFLNGFLFEVKDELIPLTLEARLTKEFLSIHQHALGRRLKNNVAVSGNIQAHVCPPLLLVPFISNVLKMVYKCNISFESTVLIKAEKKYVLLTFSFWSENDFRLPETEVEQIIKKRLMFSYPGKHRIIDNVEENFAELSIEIFD